MAGVSLLALIDKIAVMLDDVALMTKVAAKKTAGVLGDDLALNAQQVSGVSADRELPVVFAVAKGSAINKLILVPLALAASVFLPWLITPLLMLGGIYLCYEGFEKVWHSFTHKPDSAQPSERQQPCTSTSKNTDLLTLEQDKIKGAIRTDFILSAEIIVIALGTVQQATFYHQLIVVSAISILMTIGVYGLVAGIVKLDDAGLYLLRSGSYKQVQQTFLGKLKRFIGNTLLGFAPKLMHSLAVIGTIAMFLVGGSILVHGIPQAHHLLAQALYFIEQQGFLTPFIDELLLFITPFFFDALIGIISGGLALLIVSVFSKVVPNNNVVKK